MRKPMEAPVPKDKKKNGQPCWGGKGNPNVNPRSDLCRVPLLAYLKIDFNPRFPFWGEGATLRICVYPEVD